MTEQLLAPNLVQSTEEVKYPLDTIVLKAASRCDLACTYCFEYEGVDNSYQTDRDQVMQPLTVAQVAYRVREHADSNRLSSVGVFLHGGEPTLVGAIGLRSMCTQLRAAFDGRGAPQLNMAITTNGVLLGRRPEILEVLRDFDVKVQLSLDGDEKANSARLDHSGRSSFMRAVKGLEALARPGYKHLFLRLLAVARPQDLLNPNAPDASTPEAVYDSLAELLLRFGFNSCDFSMPAYSWDKPPPGHGTGRNLTAEWYRRVWDRRESARAQGKPALEIRVLDAIANGEIGPGTLGLSPLPGVFISTDGSYREEDTLKMVKDTNLRAANGTKLNIFDQSFDDVARLSQIKSRASMGQVFSALSDECKKCPIVAACGAGRLVTRWMTKEDGQGDFDRPSVLCPDFKSIIPYIRAQAKTIQNEAAQGGV